MRTKSETTRRKDIFMETIAAIRQSENGTKSEENALYLLNNSECYS
jgi:hypothetical protein